MKRTLNLCLETAGCPTICNHCWAQGVSYNAMPADNIRRILAQARQFCDRNGYEFDAYPMHEVAAHPQALEVLQIFQEFVTPDGKFVDPLATTGVPIAIRDDWSALLDGLQAQRVTTLWLAFHGVREVHDRAVHRQGAFEETVLAARRARDKGFKIGGNIFITRDNLMQVDELAELLQSLGIGAFWCTVNYSPVARLRQQEHLRPTVDDILALSGKVAKFSPINGDFWLNPEKYSEAAYYEMATKGDGFDYSYSESGTQRIMLVVRPNLDLHSGKARLYGQRHGNIGTDDLEQLFESAVDFGPVSDDTLYYGNSALPDLRELAADAGDSKGQSVHPDGGSMRYLWLDRYMRNRIA